MEKESQSAWIFPFPAHDILDNFSFRFALNVRVSCGSRRLFHDHGTAHSFKSVNGMWPDEFESLQMPRVSGSAVNTQACEIL